MVELIAKASAVTIDTAVRTATVNIHAMVSVLVVENPLCLDKMHLG